MAEVSLECLPFSQEYRTKIDEKIRALSDLDCAVEKDCDNKRRLLEENGYLDMLERICEISEKHFLIFKSACANDNIDDVFEELKNLVAIKKIECGEHMSFSYEDEVTDDLIGYAKFEAAMTQFRVENVDQKKLSKLFVDGKCPVSVDQWSRVVRGLVVQEAECSFRKKYILPLIQQGCHETDIYDTRQGAFADGILEVMKLGKDLASSINGSNWGRDHLKKLFTAKPGNTLSQERRRKLVDEIQDLEAKLVLSKAMYEMSNSMSKQDLSELNKLTQQVGAVKNNMEKDSNSPGKGSARSQRYQNEYAAAIKKIVKIIPFLVMTPEQVSRYVPADHRFGLGIIDEASQSDFTAVNIMVRCSKFLVVGDDKQVSPNEGGLSEKSLGFLNASLPNIENSQQLLPRFSFFDLCKVIYPTKHVFLTEHFRCPPVSNSYC